MNLYKNNSTLTKNQWIEIIEDNDICNDNFKELLLTMYSLGGAASATLIATVNKKPIGFYNPTVTTTAKKIIKSYKLSKPRLSNGEVKFRYLFFDGKDIEDNKFQWIMKDEIMAALKYLIENNKLDLKVTKEKY